MVTSYVMKLKWMSLQPNAVQNGDAPVDDPVPTKMAPVAVAPASNVSNDVTLSNNLQSYRFQNILDLLEGGGGVTAPVSAPKQSNASDLLNLLDLDIGGPAPTESIGAPPMQPSWGQSGQRYKDVT